MEHTQEYFNLLKLFNEPYDYGKLLKIRQLIVDDYCNHKIKYHEFSELEKKVKAIGKEHGVDLC
jgi:hypothetical protein